MYAYLTRYEKAKRVILLYPENIEENEHQEMSLTEKYHVENDLDKCLHIATIDYEDRNKCIEQLRNIIGN